MKFFSKKRLFILLGLVALTFLVVVAGVVVYVNSPRFERVAKDYILRQIESRTGAHATLEGFAWDPWHQRFRMDGLVLRGTEPDTAPPLARFPRIDVGVNLRSLLQRKINLFELGLEHPEFHVFIDPSGRTNLPSPSGQGPGQPVNFEISIENFRIVQGTTFVNERRIDTDFTLSNLASEMDYRSTTGILSSHLHYDGLFARPGKKTIPYTFDADMDYTRGTLIPHRIDLRTGTSSLKLQGRINDVLTQRLAGRLEYTGNVQVPFLNYFFENETFAGNADVAGFLEFSNGYFFTSGNAVADSIEYDGWHTTELRSEYNYHYPEKRAAFRNLHTKFAEGSVSGSVSIENLPGDSRVNVNLDYSGIDSTALARAYPWDPRYRVYSSLQGTLQGWFEGKLERYAFTGDIAFQSYHPSAAGGDVVPLLLDGSTEYELRPSEIRVAKADVRFGSTHITADGLIHDKASDLRVKLDSSNLRDAYFIYADANGSGTFDGTLTGPIKTPTLDGQFTLHGHTYQGKWGLDNATGHVRLNTQTEVAELQNVRLEQGRSEIIVDGNTTLNGSSADLRVQAIHVYGQDLEAYTGRKIQGVASGNLHLTAFDPVKVEGDLRVDDLNLEGRDVGNAKGHVRYFAPDVEIESLSITRGGATLTGAVALNLSTDAVKFSTKVSAIPFNELRWIGVPDTLDGIIQQAELRGEGTLKQPRLEGSASIQNLSFKGIVFPQVGVNVTSAGSTVTASIQAAENLDLTARVNIAESGYPFSANGRFTRYGLEKLVGLTEGTLNVTGTLDVEGSLSDASRLKGQGRIESAEGVIENQNLRAAAPFTFSFNPDQLVLSTATLSGKATQLSLDGTIALKGAASLGLNVKGTVDLALLAATNPDFVAGGTMTLDGQIRGTPNNPDLRGVARFTNASLSKRGFFTSLTGLNGGLLFDQNRITLNDVSGTIGGGNVLLQGTAVLQQRQVQAMNIRIDATDVRLRYPEGLRTVVDGTMILRGNLNAPLLEGSLAIQSMSYKSDFDQFLAMFSNVGVSQGPSTLGQLALALHIEGGRNITIKNQLADLEARVDLDIKGTVDNPALTGHVETSGGTLSFQGKRYTITRGSVDFIDPLSIEPVVDIQAESDLRDYRIILRVTGKGENLHLDMSSDPPLSQVEIVNLIAGGKTREELATAGGAPTQEALFKGGAASILSDLLSERLTGSALERLGVGSVRIGPDPNLISALNQTKLRLTYETQVSKDLAVTVSYDLSSDRAYVIQLEYFVTRNTSFLASRDERNEYSFDVKLRRRLK